MAKFEMGDGLDDILTKMAKLEGGQMREMIRRIVNAGAEAAAREMRGNIESAGHIRTGAMERETRPAEFREEVRGGYMNVYPQGKDSRGVSNAMKAYVINYGIGAKLTRRSRGKQRNKTGDKFITGQIDKTRPKVEAAMRAEADKALKETGLTEG